jgi:hypothetical protein
MTEFVFSESCLETVRRGVQVPRADEPWSGLIPVRLTAMMGRIRRPFASRRPLSSFAVTQRSPDAGTTGTLYRSLVWVLTWESTTLSNQLWIVRSTSSMPMSR